MNHHIHQLLYKLRFVAAGIYVCICLYLLALLVSAITKNDPQSPGSGVSVSSADAVISGSPNALSDGLATMLSNASDTTHSIQTTLLHGTRSAATAITHSGDIITSGGKLLITGTAHGFAAVGHGIDHGLLAGLRGTGHGIAFVGHTLVNPNLYIFDVPSHVLGAMSAASPVNSFVHPVDHDPVPIINPNSPELAQAVAALPATAPPAPSATAAAPVSATPLAMWPLHGAITTQFGVPEPPYEPIHTGLDISDGKPAGVTPIHAFRAGRVIDVEHRGGLGNHVVIDHGNGVTSVYGHLNSISVSVGEMVDTNTIVGYEGTTGVSTGPHLHFEIRVDGQATDPHKFISGQPYQ